MRRTAPLAICAFVLAGCPEPPGEDAGSPTDASVADAGDGGAALDAGVDAGELRLCEENADLVFVGDLVVSDDDTLTALDGIECVEGSVTVELTDLEQLSLPNLLRVTGSFHIEANHRLGRLQLGTLKTIDGDFIVRDNQALIDLSGLPLLSTVGGDVHIGGELSFYGNALVTSLAGLQSLEAVGGDFVVGNNRALNSLNGWTLTSVGGALRVVESPALNDIGALSVLTQTGTDLVLSRLDALGNLAGLEALTTVGGDLQLGGREVDEGNAALNSVVQLTGLTQVVGELLIANNPVLPQCQANALAQRLGGAGVGSTFFAGNDEAAVCQ
jgi:hypothetical protein